MKLPNEKVAEIVFSAFEQAFEEKDDIPFKDNNPHRSSYFVSLIGDNLAEHFKGAKANYLSINSSKERKKNKGEWLFDICVTSQLEIKDKRQGGVTSKINTNILFACESEFETSLSAFTTDFGKLICSNANQILFIQGLNQFTPEGRKSFIDSRKEIIKTQLHYQLRDDLVLAFIPTPGKIGNKSFWDNHEAEVLSWAKIWIYSVSENEFIEYETPIENVAR